MEIVRDALSCVGLAVVGAAAVATVANPITLAGIAGGLAGNMAANLATDVWKKLDRTAAAKALRGWRGISENHVVVQALRRAHLEALKAA